MTKSDTAQSTRERIYRVEIRRAPVTEERYATYVPCTNEYVPVEEIERAEAERDRYRDALEWISAQGPYHGVDGKPWRHWSCIASVALERERQS